MTYDQDIDGANPSKMRITQKDNYDYIGVNDIEGASPKKMMGVSNHT